MGNFWENSEMKREEVEKNISQINEITKTYIFTKKLKVYLIFNLDDDSIMKRNTRKIIKVNVYDYDSKKALATERKKPISISIEDFYHYFNSVMNSRTMFLSEQMKQRRKSKSKKSPGETEEEEDDESGICPICNENKVNLSLPCTHFFCEKCIKTWLVKSDSCPMCRHKLKLNKKSPSGVSGAQSWNIIDDLDEEQTEKEHEKSLKNLTKKIFF